MAGCAAAKDICCSTAWQATLLLNHLKYCATCVPEFGFMVTRLFYSLDFSLMKSLIFGLKKSCSHKKSWIQLSSDFLCLDKKIVQMVHEKHHYVCCRVQNLLNFQQHLEAYQIIQHKHKKVHALRGVVFGVLCLWEAGQWH